MSYTTIDSHRLRAWCDQVISCVYKSRDSRKNRATQKFLNEYNNDRACTRRWFARPTLTLDQAVAHLEARWARLTVFDSHPWLGINWYGNDAFEIAQKLKKSCLVSERVSVASEDVSHLVDWSPEGAIDSIFGELPLR